MIIDCHCHAGKGDGLTGPWDTSAPLQRYLARADAAGIERSVLFPVFDSDYRAANRRLAEIVASTPRRFIGFAMVHPQRDRGRVAEIMKEAVQGYGFRGIKVHRHDARVTREICEAARYWKIPLLYDVVGDVATVDLIAEEYPDVAFIIPHLGSFADDWGAQRSLIDRLMRYANVFADTAGVRRFDLLEEAVARAGAHKIIFGSDGVFLHPGLELEKIKLLKLPPEQYAKVAGENLFGLLRRIRRNSPGGRSSNVVRLSRAVGG
jgi:predicted TIM-barrel fold metal-dependent hydrolase